MRQPCASDPDPAAVRRLTFVPFMPNGDVALVRATSGRPCLPTGDLREGEHFLDAALRIPLETAGFRMQRFHPFAREGTHLFGWLDGDRYTGGSKAYRQIELVTEAPEAAVARLCDAGDQHIANLIEEAARSFRTQSDESYYADNLRLLERAYLAAGTPEAGSGFGRDAAAWRAMREEIVDGVDRDGTFLDLGCANGLLLESVVTWAAERGFRIEPYGVDISPALVELARRRLPHWSDRIWTGNALGWMPPSGRRFDFVHALLDFVPVARRRALVLHLLENVAAPEGRLLISHYAATPPTTADMLRELGFDVAGEAYPHDSAHGPRSGTAWLDRARRHH